MTGSRPAAPATRVSQTAQRLQRLAAMTGVSSHETRHLGSASSAACLSHPYLLPPPEIAEIVDRVPPPRLVVSPDRRLVLQLSQPHANPPISELSRPELKLAGIRIDPELYSRSRMSHYTALAVAPFSEAVTFPLASGQGRVLGPLPPGSWINFATWSPGSSHVAFTLRSDGQPGSAPRGPLTLWVADASDGRARQVLSRPLNTVMSGYAWADDSTLVCCALPEEGWLAGLPPAPPAPVGPKIEDNSGGKRSQTRTYPDLLCSRHDEEVFAHLLSSEVWAVDVATGEARSLQNGRSPQLYGDVVPSPDGRFITVSRLERPFSYSVPCSRFPRRVEVWNRDGQLVRQVASLPLAEDIPVAFDSCRQGPRQIEWRDDRPSSLVWIECQDGGDPEVAVSPRDVLYQLDVEEDGGKEAQALAGTELRAGGVAWGRGDCALLYESEWKARRSVVSLIEPDAALASGRLAEKSVLHDRHYEDAYTDPGHPLFRRTRWGTHVLALVDGRRKLLMQGAGASAEGNRPFLDLFDLDSRETERLWRCSGPVYEAVSSILSHLEPDEPVRLENLQLLVSRETATDNPQFLVRTLDALGGVAHERRLSDFPHPYPSLRGLQKEILRYERADGVQLTATLYLPPGYSPERDGRLPCLLWAYPREFKDRGAAGQLRRSPHQFAGVDALSPILWTARGWAVLDGPTFPIVAEGEEEPNDSFVEQLVASAKAAVDVVVGRGIADPRAVAVGGHSYGAFMAANLLVHAPELFACGIGRSGAYNRTLTPFSFQQEQRTLWQAPDTYLKMSPFMHADRMRRPFLIIHGAEDNNTGTFTMQSERLYAALKGHGAVTRLVLLPHESHGYRALESVMHTLREQDDWLSRYCGADGGQPAAEREAAA